MTPSSPAGALAPYSSYLAEVRQYYDEALPEYLRVFGATFQVALIGNPSDQPSEAASNVALAEAAGVRPGDRILDAGCGVCGPAEHIARWAPDLELVGVTVSPRQAQHARARVAAARLADRIRVLIGDFHALPFGDRSFDVALFLESACYAYDRPRLFREVFRMLRPGGRLLVKDVFRRPGECAAEVVAEFDRFNGLYRARIGTVADFVRPAREAGFDDIVVQPLAGRMQLREYLSGPESSLDRYLPAPRGRVREMIEMATIRARVGPSG